MKFIVLLFGAVAFSLVMLSGFSVGRQPDLVLRDAALACLGAAFIGRWFGQVLQSAFAQTLAARQAESLVVPDKISTPPAPALPPALATARPRGTTPPMVPAPAGPAPVTARAR